MQHGGALIKWDSGTFLVEQNGISALIEVAHGREPIKNLNGVQNTGFLPGTGDERFLNINSFYNHITSMSGGAPADSFQEDVATTDTTDVTDMEVNFQPDGQNGVMLANAKDEGGDIRIAADVRGDGASIKSDGEIRLVGMGFDIDAGTSDEGPSISLYAKEDIVISTLKPDGSGDYVYSGMDLRGLLYSWANIELKAGHEDEDNNANPQRVYLQGAMVAYGGEPGVEEPGDGGGGNILLTGDQIDVVFDPTKLIGVRSEGGFPVGLKLVSRSFR
jgi:hypothetical protein